MKTIKSILAVALCAVGFAAFALPPSPYRDIWSSTPDPHEIKDPTDVIDWGMSSRTFESPEAKHGKFLEASADAMIAAYSARIAKDPTDYEAYICRAFAYLKKAGENQAFFDLAQEFGYTFDNDTMHFTGELIHKKGVTPEMNDATAEVCDILLPLMKSAYADLVAIPYNWKGEVAITPDIYPVDEEIYFDWADVLMAKTGLAEMMCVLNMVKGFDMTMDSDLLEYTFNSRSPKNGKRGVQPILENNPDFFSKVRDQKAATEAGDWWASAATLLDQWDKAQAKRSDGKQHFFDWNFEHLDHKAVTSVAWLRTHRDGLINLPYWASPFDWTLMNGDKSQFWTFQPLFAGKFLREHFPEFGVGVKEPWCNEPMLDTLPDPTFCGIWPGVSRTYIGALMTQVARAGDFTTLPPYTDDKSSSVHAIWYDNMFELGFDNTGNPAMFAWESQSPLVLLDPEFNVRGVTAVFTGWSFIGYPNGTQSEWDGSAIPTPYTKESPMYKRRNVVATANFEVPQVTYLDFEGGKLSERTDECELVKAETTTFEAGKVYAVPVDVTIPNRITVSGTPASPAKLVLCDGVTLSVANGIEVAAGSALIICGQALGTGILEATGSSGTAGIGSGGTVTINGGTVMATGGSSGSGIGGGTVTINAGTVTATGRDGAAGIAGTVKFADGIAYGVAAGADEANALYKTAAAYAAAHSAAYVALPYFSLKIPVATEGYSYEVSCAGVESKAALAGGVNMYAIATGATARVSFTLDSEDYVWEKAPDDNPMIIAKISGDTVVDAADLPTVKFAKKGGAENPWTVGAPNADDVIAYTNGVGELVVEGSGDMKDFDPSSDPAPWGTGITEVEIGEDVTGIGANAFNDSQLGSVTIPASVTSIGAAAFFCSTSLSNVTVEAMTPPALGEGAFVELAEGYKIIVPQGTGAAYKAAPDWSLYADSIFEQGSPECPWEIGKTAGDSVIAYLDGDGKLVIEGEGDMKDFDPSSDPAPWGTGITEVEIGEDVTGIGANAFAGSTSLSSVTVEAMTPPTLGADAFAGTAEDLKIAVPFGTGETYKEAPGWGDYADSIVEQGTPECPWTVGTGVTAYIDENGTLHVEGEGNMKDFTAADPAPWGASSADIKSIEIGEGVTKVGNCAFIDCSIDAPNTFTVDDEDFELNLLAFVSADGSATNAPATEVFRVVKSETGMAEPVVAFGPKDSTAFSFSIERSLRDADWTTVQLLTPNAAQEREYGYLVSLAGETPYSKSMKKLLGDTKAALGNATTYNEIAQVEAMYKSQIEAKAEKDKSHEIEDTDITWRDLDGMLVIEGEGEMPDFVDPDFPSGAPWGTDITSVKIGEDVTGIGAKAFTDSQLGSATIPETVTNIGASAFADCTSLSNMVVEAMTPPALGADALSGCTAIETIYVPYGTSEAYKAAPGWSDFADRIVELPQPIVAESDEFTVDLRTSVELVDGETTISNVTWSATLWGEVSETFTTVGWTNLSTGATGVFGNLSNIMGEGATDAVLPLKDGEYVLTHSTGDLKSFVTFLLSGTGNPVGSKENPWVIGKTADDSVVAYTNGVGGIVVEGEGDMRDFDPSGDPAPWGTDVTEVEIGENVTGIGANAFKDSTSLTNVTVLANTPPAMGADAFSGCDAIEIINVPKGTGEVYKTAPGWSEFADKISEQGSKENPWKVGDGVTAYIDEDGTLHVDGDGAMTDFSDDYPAPWAEFADEVKSADIGEGITGIGANAFNGCSSLTNVIVEATVPPSLGEDAFSGCDNLENILVPWTTGDDYRGASGWEDCADKVLEMPGSPENPWKVGPADDPEATVAWTDGDGTVYFKPPRSSVSREGLETITNALGGTGFGIALVDADGAATNDVEMIVGASGTEYTTLDEMLASDDDTFILLDVPGVYVEFNAMGGVHTNGLEIVTNFCVVTYALPAVKRDGYTFDGWYDGWKTGANKVEAGQDLLSYEPHSLYAVWTSNKPTPTAGELDVPDIRNGQPVTAIEAKQYVNNTSLKNVTTPLYLKSIGQRAFMGCTSLEKLTITAARDYGDLSPVTVEIGQNAFSGCSSLDTAYIAAEVSEIGQSAFQNCANLKKIIFMGDGAITYGASAFYRCGYQNGTGALKVYMSSAFQAANPTLIADFQKWNTQVQVIEKVDVMPVNGIGEIAGIDLGSMSADRRVAVLVKTSVLGTPDPDDVDIEHTEALNGIWSPLTAGTEKTANPDGTVLIEIKVPEGAQGFFRAKVTE